MSKNETLNQYKNLITDKMQQFNKRTKVMILSGVIGCFALSAAIILTTGTQVYSLAIEGRNAGYITEKAIVENAVKEITADYAKAKEPVDVTVNTGKITYKKTDYKKDEVKALSTKELEKKIVASGICTAKAWAVTVDGRNVAATASQSDAEEILSKVKIITWTTGASWSAPTSKKA